MRAKDCEVHVRNAAIIDNGLKSGKLVGVGLLSRRRSVACAEQGLVPPKIGNVFGISNQFRRRIVRLRDDQGTTDLATNVYRMGFASARLFYSNLAKLIWERTRHAVTSRSACGSR